MKSGCPLKIYCSVFQFLSSWGPQFLLSWPVAAGQVPNFYHSDIAVPRKVSRVYLCSTCSRMPPNNPPYRKDEVVLCFHHEILYEAKILEVRLINPDDRKSAHEFRVHYKGWKNTYVFFSCSFKRRCFFFSLVLLDRVTCGVKHRWFPPSPSYRTSRRLHVFIKLKGTRWRIVDHFTIFGLTEEYQMGRLGHNGPSSQTYRRKQRACCYSAS